jgi:serine/threonine-protein kinase
MSDLALDSKVVENPLVIGGRYDVKRLLGKGGMGEVYEALDRETRRRVAVKLLAQQPARPAVEAEAAKRFSREILAMACCASRHVVAVPDAGIDNDTGRPFMVMDYLEGEDLGSIAERLGNLPVDVALRLVAQVCDGLAAAHAAGVVHRDIKPSNLFLVAPTTSGRVVKILDFGIARVRLLDVESALTDLTQTGAIIGSPLYMAPEQLRGARELDHRADVWSLGVVLYRLLAGTVPHNGATIADLLVTVCSEPAPPIRERAPWVPADVAALVHRALQIEVDARTPSARTFADELWPLLPDGTLVTDAMLVTHGAAPRTLPIRASDECRVGVPRETVGRARAPRTWRVRGVFVWVLAITAVFGATTLAYQRALSVEPNELPPVAISAPTRDTIAPVELRIQLASWLADSDGSAWWARVKTACTAPRYLTVLPSAPPSPSGRAFAIACAALAGDLAWVRRQLESLSEPKRPFAVAPLAAYTAAMFANRIDDPAVRPLAELALFAWPDSSNMLYAAGVTELEAGERTMARDHLRGFVDHHRPDDVRLGTANMLLETLTWPLDCGRVLVDHRNRKIPIASCVTPRRTTSRRPRRILATPQDGPPSGSLPGIR